MKAETAVTTLKGLRERLELYHGLAQASQRDVIALAFAHNVSGDEVFLIIAQFLTQGIVLIPGPWLLKIREAYKLLEKLPASKEFIFDYEVLKHQAGEAVTKHKKKQQPTAESDEPSAKFMKEVDSFDNFFAVKPSEKEPKKDKPPDDPIQTNT
jgi:hypothetical protein